MRGIKRRRERPISNHALWLRHLYWLQRSSRPHSWVWAGKGKWRMKGQGRKEERDG